MKFEVLAERYSKLPHDKKVDTGKAVFKLLNAKLAKLGYSEKEILSFAVQLARLAAGADNAAAEEEHKLLVEITGIELDKFEFFAMIKNAEKEDFVRPMDEIVDSLDKEAKEACLTLVALFISTDKQISPLEKALFDRLEA